MTLMLGLVTLSILGLIAVGVYYELNPAARAPRARWLKAALGGNLALVRRWGSSAPWCSASRRSWPRPRWARRAVPRDLSGLGLALIGIGLPTGLATIGAGLAVGPVGCRGAGGHRGKTRDVRAHADLSRPRRGHRHLRPGGYHPAAGQDLMAGTSRVQHWGTGDAPIPRRASSPWAARP